MAKMPGARASPASRLMPLPQAIRHASADYMAPLFLHSGCVQWMEKAVDNCAQALCCKAFKTMANISPACCNASRRFCRSGVSREADGPSDGIAAWCFGMVSFAAYAAPTSLRTEPPCGSCMSREADASSDGIAASRFGMVSFAAYAAPTSLRAELPCGSCVSREADTSSDGTAAWCFGMVSFAADAAPTSLSAEPPCGCGVSREANALSDGTAAGCSSIASFAADAAPTSKTACVCGLHGAPISPRHLCAMTGEGCGQACPAFALQGFRNRDDFLTTPRVTDTTRPRSAGPCRYCNVRWIRR